MNKDLLFDISDESSPLLPLGKDEMNFAELPMALMTDRVPKGQTILKFEDEVYDEKKKKMVPRRRIIEGSEEYGLPTATDDRVVLALIQLTKLKGDFTKREVEFTRLELIKMLGWADEGRSYDRIKNSLLRIKAVNYIYDNAWWDSRQKSWTTRAFSIIDNVEINDSRTTHGQNGLFSSRIVWNEVVFGSFQAGFLRDIDFNLCMKLEHPTALRIYRFLGKRFYFKTEWEFDLKQFAHIFVGLGRNYEGGTQIARKLKPAVAELEAVGFLEPLSDEERFTKKGQVWSIRFVQKNAVLPAPASSEPVELPDLPPVTDALRARGVSAKAANRLVKQWPASYIEAQIEVFDWLRANDDPRCGKSASGYLVKSIDDEYQAPPEFVPKAERDRQAATAAEKYQADVAAARQRQEQAKRERDLAGRIARYRETLTPEELAQLEAQVIEQASEEQRQSLSDPVMSRFRNTLIHQMVEENIRQIVISQEEPA